MSTSNKYIVYQCSVCQRETEIMLDGRRPDPVRCNITLKCRGKLQKSGERSVKGSLFTPIVQGLDDYIPRGTITSSIPIPKPVNPVTLFTGSEGGMIAAAVVRRTSNAQNDVHVFSVMATDGSNIILEMSENYNIPIEAKMYLKVYEVTPELLQYKKYTYTDVPAGTQAVKGVDNSLDGRNLRFTDRDNITVFLNGVELRDVINGSPTEIRFDRSVDNEIKFSPALIDGNNMIEILVYTDGSATTPEEEMIELEFVPLAINDPEQIAIRDKNCWGNFGGVNIFNFTTVHRSILYCFNFSDLDVNKSYSISKAEIQWGTGSAVQRREIHSSEIYFLLGREPFLPEDKELHAYFGGDKLIQPGVILSYRQSTGTGAYELVADGSLVTQIFNPMVPVVPVVGFAATSDAISTQRTVSGTEDLKRKYILGPS